jgi:hypothetical protein
MELFFPVWGHERDALMRHEFDGAELAGMDRIEFENSGAGPDAIWVAAELPDDEASGYEEPGSKYLGYRSVVLPNEVLNALVWREVPPAEVTTRSQG